MLKVIDSKAMQRASRYRSLPQNAKSRASNMH
jgi:hypothetical protein